MTRRRAVTALAGVPLIVVGLASCAPSPESWPPFLPSAGEACVSWVGHETPQDVYDDATLVLVGESSPAGTTNLYGVTAAVHQVQVLEVLKGDAGGYERIAVASTPVTCTGDGVYPDGDPLEVDGELILFLTRHEDGDGWRTLTPLAGVLSMPADGMLPFDPTGVD